MAKLTRSVLFNYLLAVIAVAAALIGSMELMPILQGLSFSLFFAAVMVSAWYGGLGPGLLATALATAASAYFFLPPTDSFAILAIGDIVRLGIFALVAALINTLTEARRRAEQATREQREWLRVVLRSIADAVIATDTNGYVTFMNRAAQDRTGWKQEEVIGKPLTDFFKIIDAKTREPLPSPATHVIVTGKVVSAPGSTVLIAKDGSETPIVSSGAPIRDDEDKLKGVVLIFRDRTEDTLAETSNPAAAI
jgi:PAS domain S-box-containing protein